MKIGTLRGGDLQLCSADFSALMTLLDASEDESPDYGPVFKYSQPYNKPRLTVQNYVGVIRTQRKTQLEILPKIAKRGAGGGKVGATPVDQNAYGA